MGVLPASWVCLISQANPKIRLAQSRRPFVLTNPQSCKSFAAKPRGLNVRFECSMIFVVHQGKADFGADAANSQIVRGPDLYPPSRIFVAASVFTRRSAPPTRFQCRIKLKADRKVCLHPFSSLFERVAVFLFSIGWWLGRSARDQKREPLGQGPLDALLACSR